MNEVKEKLPEPQSEAETEKASGAWIRAQFRSDDVYSSQAGSRITLPHNDDEPLQELDGSLQQFAAALLKVGELPLRALQEAWSQDLTVLRGRLSKQTQELETASNEITNLTSIVEKFQADSSDRENRQEGVARQTEQLLHRIDALEADFSRRLGQLSSSIEKLQSDTTAQQEVLRALQREGERRTEVADRVSQVLDSLKASVNMLGGSEPRSG